MRIYKDTTASGAPCARLEYLDEEGQLQTRVSNITRERNFKQAKAILEKYWESLCLDDYEAWKKKHGDK